MRQSCLRISLLLASTLFVQTAWSQRVAVEPLAPVQAVAEPVNVAKALEQSVQATSAEVQHNQPEAAASAVVLSRPVIPGPLFLVNSSIIISGSLAAIDPHNIADVVVCKGSTIPAAWRTVAAGGILNFMLKPGVRLRSVSLDKLKRQQHLTGLVRFELDGRPLEDTSLRVATRDIGKLEISPVADDQGYKVLNIKLVELSTRPSQDPPGTIRIRGMASR